MRQFVNINEQQQQTVATTDRPLCTASASISSKKIIAGAAARALRNSSRTAFSDSPTHLDSNSGPLYKYSDTWSNTECIINKVPIYTVQDWFWNLETANSRLLLTQYFVMEQNLPSTLDECRLNARCLQPSDEANQLGLCIHRNHNCCYGPHPPSSLITTTQLKSGYSFTERRFDTGTTVRVTAKAKTTTTVRFDL